MLSAEEFNSFKDQGFNRIPVVQEVLADLDTPLSAYVKLSTLPYSYLFESVQGGEKWGRYSIIGIGATRVLRVYGKKIVISDSHGQTIEQTTAKDPLEWIEQYQSQFKVPEIPNLPLFSGGLVGYFGFDTIRYIEPKLGDCPNPDPLGNPDILLMLSDTVAVFDNLKNVIHLIVHADVSKAMAYEAAIRKLQELTRRLAGPVKLPEKTSSKGPVAESDFVSGFSEAGFKDAVLKAKEYIKAGDVMQVVLSQRLSIPYQASALDLYRSLRTLNPSPYMFYLNLDEFQVVGSSPEILVRLEDNKVTVRPIAGTRPRGMDEAADKALEVDLLSDPKELAEHLMLIDLGRNDAGRVAKIGTVDLTDKMIIERYSHVMHIVSNVEAELQDGLSAMDVLRATFPAGTVSGAPKIRAMEIIDELEPVKRGVYAGAVGYIGWQGNMDTAIAIRTAVIKDNQLHVQAGAGIVYDSIAQNEWDETMNKGRAVFKAVSMAEEGLDPSPQHR